MISLNVVIPKGICNWFSKYDGNNSIRLWIIIKNPTDYGRALIPQLIGHSTYNWALRYLSAAYVSIALLGEPIGTTILALFLLKEAPTILEIVGGILTLLGIYIASRITSSS